MTKEVSLSKNRNKKKDESKKKRLEDIETVYKEEADEGEMHEKNVVTNS